MTEFGIFVTFMVIISIPTMLMIFINYKERK